MRSTESPGCVAESWRPTRLARAWAWAPALGWAGLILYAFTRTNWGAVEGVINPATAGMTHVVLYAVLGFLVHRALRFEGLRSAEIFWVGLVACSLYGTVGEFVQAFIPRRGASLLDVGLNATGSALGLLLGAYWSRRRLPGPRG